MRECVKYAIRKTLTVMILDAGCGVAHRESDVNIDLFRNQSTDSSKHVIADIQHLPFPSETFEKTICYHVLEHLEDPIQALDELIRVTKGLTEIRVPHRFGYYPDKTHVNSFTCRWFKQYAKWHRLNVRAILRIDPERKFYTLPLEIFVWLWIK